MRERSLFNGPGKGKHQHFFLQEGRERMRVSVSNNKQNDAGQKGSCGRQRGDDSQSEGHITGTAVSSTQGLVPKETVGRAGGAVVVGGQLTWGGTRRAHGARQPKRVRCSKQPVPSGHIPVQGQGKGQGQQKQIYKVPECTT